MRIESLGDYLRRSEVENEPALSSLSDTLRRHRNHDRPVSDRVAAKWELAHYGLMNEDTGLLTRVGAQIWYYLHA